ncbi:MAG: AIPR family protein, partial [Bacteroidetes bacterium]|nr:AIPR family protein [Bacteroidota bacterium]
MMDNIAKSFLDSFIIKFGFDTTLKDSLKFEYFCAYSLLSQEINNNLLKTDLEAISTGNAKGVDTIAFCINGKLILTEDEIDNFENQNLVVDAYFFQSKTSDSFNDSELGNFMDVVIDFFSDKSIYNIVEFEEKKGIYKKLISKVANIRKFNLHCLYISLGQRQEVQTTIDSTKKIKMNTLTQNGLFQNIRIDLIDKSTLLNIHRKAINPLEATFKFENKTTLSNIKNVDEAYIGFIPFAEFKNLIMDEAQTKVKSLFNDNLRDFLGLENPINQSIKNTLESGKFNEFSLLNNGVTIIADTNVGKSNTFILQNYQIVNGCQTSNVLFECKNIENIDSVLIPLKIVITKDENLRDEIILTTNSQSRFTEEQLFAITQFQKTLEDFYVSHQQLDNLHYERRSNQYANEGIARNNVIEIREQLKSFMAMFFDLPHLVAGNIGKIVRDKKDSFFQKEHSPIPYYISGLISSRWEKLYTKFDDLKRFNKYRYHIFMGVRYLVENLQFQTSFIENPNTYSVKVGNKRENSFDKLLEIIRDDKTLLSYFRVAVDVFSQIDYN